MKLEFSIDQSDCLAFNKYAMMKSKGFINPSAKIRIWFLLVLVFFTFFKFTNLKVSSDFIGGIAFMFLVFFLLFVLALFKRKKIFLSRLTGSFFGPKTLEIDEIGIREEGDGHTCSYTWSHVQVVAQMTSHLFIGVDSTDIRLAGGYLIPDRAFASHTMKEEFLTFLKGYATHAKYQ